MFGILAVIFFALGFIFHGAGFQTSAWLSAASMGYLGLVFLALHLLGVGAGVSVFHRTVPAPVAPPQ